MIALGIAACVLTLWLIWRIWDREARGWADIICDEVFGEKDKAISDANCRKGKAIKETR
jgi:hypothetical protein